MANFLADKAKSGAQPRTLHEGAVTVRAKYIGEAGTSLSAGSDVIQCVKIPNGAIIDDVVLMPLVGEGSTPSLTVTVGDGDDPNRYATGTLSTVAVRAATGLGYKYELSDDAAVQYDTIDVSLTAGVLSASQGFYLTVTYHCDD